MGISEGLKQGREIGPHEVKKLWEGRPKRFQPSVDRLHHCLCRYGIVCGLQEKVLYLSFADCAVMPNLALNASYLSSDLGTATVLRFFHVEEMWKNARPVLVECLGDIVPTGAYRRYVSVPAFPGYTNRGVLLASAQVPCVSVSRYARCPTRLSVSLLKRRASSSSHCASGSIYQRGLEKKCCVGQCSLPAVAPQMRCSI